MAKKRTLILRGTELYSQHVHLSATLVPPNVPARPGTPPLVEMLIFSDDITEINGKTNLGPSQHTGFCLNVRGQDLWLCQAAFILPGIPKKPFKKGGQIQARGMLDFSSSANASRYRRRDRRLPRCFRGDRTGDLESKPDSHEVHGQNPNPMRRRPELLAPSAFPSKYASTLTPRTQPSASKRAPSRRTSAHLGSPGFRCRHRAVCPSDAGTSSGRNHPSAS